MRVRLRLKHAMTPLRNHKAFTLLELLVVVLIIGVLAAVALPQYQKAVMKSRYATLKNLTESIFQAHIVYYLANDAYADDLAKLDINLPAGYTDTSDESISRYDYDWGWCRAWKNQPRAECYNSAISMSYNIKQKPDTSWQHSCIVRGSEDPADMPLQSQVCIGETGKTTSGGHGNYNDGPYVVWIYE